MDLSQAIRLKRAVREFRPDPLPIEVIEVILQAGRRAQSSKNTQPWEFVVVQERERLQELSRLGTYAGHLAGAAMAVVMVSPDPAARPIILFDLGQSAAYMQLAAWGLGVGSCLASIYEPEKARRLLGVPEDRAIRIAISFGYPQEAAVLQNPPRGRGRRRMEEIVAALARPNQAER